MKFKLESTGYEFDLPPAQKLGGGGEGAVFRFGERHLVKIFLDPSADKERHVRHLLSNWKTLIPRTINPPLWAFPVDVVLDTSTGSFVGYKMDRVTNSWPLSYTFDANKISRHQLQFDMKALAIVLRNMWNVIRVSHAVGFVLSDITPVNFMFNRDGHVTAIDTDSIQVQTGGYLFPSCTGTLGYLAPEIARGRDLTVKRHSYHDVFSAAVVTYEVMTGGFHFSDGKVSNSKGNHIPSTPERVELGLWPHSSRHDFGNYKIEAPQDVVDFSMWSPELQRLFQWTFDVPNPNRRPTPKQWRDALTRFATELCVCPVGDHQIHRSNITCPWCALEQRAA